MTEFRHETTRLILRDWREEDWPEFFRVTNSPAVMRWLGGVMDGEGMARQRARVEGCRAAHGHCFWVVERREDRALLGFCGIKRADSPGSSIAGRHEIGWRLREDAWGRGYAREAATATVALAFDHFAAPEVFATTIAENTPSWGLMERLGMRRRPELDYADIRYPPPWRQAIVYALAAADWRPA
ncbi:N-acetyltransferase [Erythrobacteraceae bacterium CFH 75059]|uniref:GNAT family N-acetyltransferase n=1 Tax=Qipengyuania thermophila TaxID=2509361 RepID=UPI0010225B1A|nr:GNAT family N-acetyltransferase [Qipengyuania thermophila]TCD06708.1 N-acetyltransferase [Erythrobacteraceae bacterium CFH 75059]